MTREQRTDIKLEVSSLVQLLILGQAPIQGRPEFLLEQRLNNGVGEGEGNVVLDQSFTLAAAATRDFDMFDFANTDFGNGNGKDSLGQDIALQGVSLLIIRNKSATGTLRVGGKGDATAWVSPFASNADYLTIRPGGTGILISPNRYPVVDATNHVLKTEAIGSDVDFDLFLVGN